MKTKPKKLTPRARKKEATGIQVEAAKVRDRKIEAKIKKLQNDFFELDQQCHVIWQRLKMVEIELLRLEGRKNG